MTLQKFLRKTTFKIIIFVCIMIAITAVTQSFTPLVSNELALGQMQNDNTMFVLMNTYNNLKPIVNIVYAVIVMLFVGIIARDTYKFYKSINNEKEKNNNEEV